MAHSLAAVPEQAPQAPRDRRKAARERLTRAIAEVQAAATEVHASEMDPGRELVASAPAPSGRRMAYRVRDVADLCSVSVEHVTRAIERRELRAVHMGGALLVLAGELERYLASLD